MTWTVEQDDQLRFWMSKGLASSRVAAKIGYTKNAIIGRARRLGLEWTQVQGNPGTVRRPKPLPKSNYAPKPKAEKPVVKTVQPRQRGNYHNYGNNSSLAPGLRQQSLRAMLAEAAANTRKLQDAMEPEYE